MEKEIKKSTLTKTKKVDVETKKGGKYSYRYTELSDINDYIDSIGERYYQVIQKVDGDEYIFTKRIGTDAPVELLQGCKLLTAPVSSEYSNPAQEQGSALTYARRYSLMMAYGLATEDDDASSLNRPKIETLEDAENYVINFGKKHKGETLKQIFEKDQSYIGFLYDGDKTDKVIIDCIDILRNNNKPITEEKEDTKNHISLLKEYEEFLLKSDTNRDDLYEYFKVKDYTELTDKQLTEAIKIMAIKINKKDGLKKEVF